MLFSAIWSSEMRNVTRNWQQTLSDASKTSELSQEDFAERLEKDVSQLTHAPSDVISSCSAIAWLNNTRRSCSNSY